ncbi:MAG: hypothetical protein PHC70_05015 [Patescibacteria group bacterium]|jgi:hypothetical protein|nr:hypothetical protein [Patescibacteria group bacterium]
MNKIAPGGDHMSDASQQPAQQMIQASKEQKKDEMQAANPARMQFAAQKIVHTPETPSDYAKRVNQDKELKNINQAKDSLGKT